MERVAQIQELLLRSKRLPLGVSAVALAILAAVILAAAGQTRAKIRAQIAGRDGEVLHAVALMEYADDAAQGLAGPISDPGSQLGLVLKTSQLKGVLGIRLFDPQGRFVEAFPPDLRDGHLNAGDLPTLGGLKPVSHYHPARRMSEIFFTETGDKPAPHSVVPVLEINVPLHAPAGGPLAGIAQFLMEGSSIAAEYARLDRHLAGQAIAAFGAGGGILSLAIGWAFRRLRRAHHLLAERTENLVRANQELALAAKTSALGAVTAHLIHGLKNPLAGLQSFVASRGTTPAAVVESDWQQAVASTRRMQEMIAQAVSLLREEQTGTRYEISLAECGEILASRTRGQADAAGVTCRIDASAPGVLPNRTANLALLILQNLVENALEATPRGKAVTVTASQHDGRMVFEVRDEGPGFPADLTPFTPCHSTKEGGTGIGLALCKQLALHLGADLELKRNGATGCVFALSLPAAVGREKSDGARLPVLR